MKYLSSSHVGSLISVARRDSPRSEAGFVVPDSSSVLCVLAAPPQPAAMCCCQLGLCAGPAAAPCGSQRSQHNHFLPEPELISLENLLGHWGITVTQRMNSGTGGEREAGLLPVPGRVLNSFIHEKVCNKWHHRNVGLLGGYELVSIRVGFSVYSILSPSIKFSGEHFTGPAFSVGEGEGKQAHNPVEGEVLGDYSGCRGPCIGGSSLPAALSAKQTGSVNRYGNALHRSLIRCKKANQQIMPSKPFFCKVTEAIKNMSEQSEPELFS